MTQEQQERAEFRQRWHEHVNRFTDGKLGTDKWPSFMYQAMDAASESRRLAGLFRAEREGKLKKVHIQCATVGTPPVAVPYNHLTCCLGVKCRECPYLLALEGGGERALTVDQQDEAKAWTCVSHILMSGGDKANEGFILTSDDRLYWDNVYASLAAGSKEGEL